MMMLLLCSSAPNARMPVIMGYDSKDQLSVALMVEETMDSDKRPDDSWKGTLWPSSHLFGEKCVVNIL